MEIWPVYFGLFVFFLVLVTLSLSLTFFQIKSLDGEKKSKIISKISLIYRLF